MEAEELNLLFSLSLNSHPPLPKSAIDSALKSHAELISRIKINLSSFLHEVDVSCRDEFVVALMRVARFSESKSDGRNDEQRKKIKKIAAAAQELWILIKDENLTSDSSIVLSDLLLHRTSFWALEVALMEISNASIPFETAKRRLKYICDQVHVIFGVERFGLRAGSSNDGFLASAIRAVCDVAGVKHPDDVRHWLKVTSQREKQA